MRLEAETSARPGFRAYEDSVRLSVAELTTCLREILGAKLVAYIGHVSHTRSVSDWADGTRTPSEGVVQRLRAAYRIAGLLYESEGQATVQAWFQGMNPLLNDAAPAMLLRDEPIETAGPLVLSAARTFTAVG